MPSASVSIATSVKPGLFASCRPPNLRSCPKSPSDSVHFICISLRASRARQYLRVPSRSPNRRRASARAASADQPSSASSCATRSRWSSSSASTSAETWAAVRQGNRKRRRRGMASGGLQDLGDGRDVAPPGRDLGLQGAAPLVGEAIELGAAVVLGEAPFGFDPALALQAVEGLVQGRVLEAEGAVAPLADRARDVVAVHRVPGERLEDQDRDSALHQFERAFRHGFVTSQREGKDSGAYGRCKAPLIV